MKNRVALCLGGNIGDRKKLLFDAVELIKNKIGSLKGSSSLYETEAWGFDTESLFLNQVIIIETNKTAVEVLRLVLDIEKILGRMRTNATGYQSRPMDIDIIFYNNCIMNNPHLMLPHPRLHKRKFVLLPLNEVSPDWIHPLFRKTTNELLNNCEDSCEVTRWYE